MWGHFILSNTPAYQQLPEIMGDGIVMAQSNAA